MKREKRLTKKERKGPSLAPARHAAAGGAATQQKHVHIHCIACGKHLDPESFGEPNGADFLRCDHGSDFPHCVTCLERARALVVEHDRTGQPVAKVAAWH